MTARALLNRKAAEQPVTFGIAHDGEEAQTARLADQFVRWLWFTRDVIAVAPE